VLKCWQGTAANKARANHRAENLPFQPGKKVSVVSCSLAFPPRQQKCPLKN